MNNTKMSLNKESPIAIVGAGVFGLSSAIHLAKAGYKNITVFDQQPYHETQYDFDRGCDAASADCNKIIRAAYGHEVWYQDLTLEAIKEWESWNESLSDNSSSGLQLLPPGMKKGERIYVNCGNYHFGDGENQNHNDNHNHSGQHGLNEFEKLSVENLAKAGLGHTQYIFSDDAKEAERARADGLGYAVDPFNLGALKDGKYRGYLDTIGGFVYADKACRYALHLAQTLGVRFVLDRQAGRFDRFVEKDGIVTGIQMADRTTHPAALTIVACGGWTPGLILPEMDGLCETTAGSVVTIQIPESSPLRQRLSPDNFPVFNWNVHAGENGNLYGFPLTDNGVLKIGYRGTKYTNPQRFEDRSSSSPSKVRSVPITKWTSPSITGLPEKSTNVIQGFLDTYLPELRDAGISTGSPNFHTRLCWYTDSFDNHWVIYHVPGKSGVIVATGGSGHAFKFLPLLGRFVVERATGAGESELLKLFRWRHLKEGEEAHNKLMKGFDDVNALQKVKLIGGGVKGRL
ncbi:hypothetical protein MAP00_007781 [Monascus purpureus]|nr:hypothetical protein MAP00_007781 [Monascus purpureus]